MQSRKRVSNKSKLCRCCMRNIEDSGQSLIFHLRDMFTACTGLQIIDLDGLPECVCSLCASSIVHCYEFIKCCKQTDICLRGIDVNASNCWESDVVKVEKEDLCDNNIQSNDPFNDDSLLDDEMIKIENVNYSNTEETNSENLIQNKTRKKVKTKQDSENCLNTKEKFTCDHCSKEFLKKCYLKQHIFIHNPIKPFTCDICNKKFKKNCLLQDHRDSHFSERRFKCEYCPKSFATRNILSIHIRQHNDPKIICDLCGKRFTQMCNLKVHMRIHTGEKPFACSTCTYRSVSQSELAKHLRVHTKIRPYSCEVCSKKFTNKSSQVRHNRIHTGELPYKCTYCPKAFIDSDKKKIHMIKAHNIAKTDIPIIRDDKKYTS